LAAGRCSRSSGSAMVRLVGAARACAAGGLPLSGGSGGCGGVFGGGQAVGGGGRRRRGRCWRCGCGVLRSTFGVLWSTLEYCRRWRRLRRAVERFCWHGVCRRHGGGGGLRRCSGQRGRRGKAAAVAVWAAAGAVLPAWQVPAAWRRRAAALQRAAWQAWQAATLPWADTARLTRRCAVPVKR
jgi:hypothetical protein